MLHSGTARTDSGTGAGALVRMATVDEAAQAIAHLHNQRLAGSVMPLVVRFADTQVGKSPAGSLRGSVGVWVLEGLSGCCLRR